MQAGGAIRKLAKPESDGAFCYLVLFQNSA